MVLFPQLSIKIMIMILVSKKQIETFFDKVSKSTALKKGTVNLFLSKSNEEGISIFSINSIEVEVFSKLKNDLQCKVSIQYIRNFRDYLRTVPEQPFKIFFSDNRITPILECPTPCSCFL